MNKLFTIGLIFVSMLITSCATNVKEPKGSAPIEAQQAWDNLPIDSTTDEEFFNSTN